MKFLTIIAIIIISLALEGCASSPYSRTFGYENTTNQTVLAAAGGALIGGLTAGEGSVRKGLRQGAAYGAATGLIYSLGQQSARTQSRPTNSYSTHSYRQPEPQPYRYKKAPGRGYYSEHHHDCHCYHH